MNLSSIKKISEVISEYLQFYKICVSFVCLFTNLKLNRPLPYCEPLPSRL